MKYLVVVPDGAGDDKIEALGGKSVLDAADMPFTDGLAARGEVGMVRTVPPGIAPGSDAANLSVMGYDPSVYLTGRSPLEAASIGIRIAMSISAFFIGQDHYYQQREAMAIPFPTLPLKYTSERQKLIGSRCFKRLSCLRVCSWEIRAVGEIREEFRLKGDPSE